MNISPTLIPNAPPLGIVAITPSDGSSLSQTIRGFMVTATGNVAVTMLDETTGVYPGCQPGAVYPGIITKVWSAGSGGPGATTATGIIGFY